MRWLTSCVLLMLVVWGGTSLSAAEKEGVHAFKANSIEGKEVDLAKYKGKVLLIVNVASRCGATKQYAGLQALYEKHKQNGLVILAFPCNQFGKQEPGSSQQIQEFCTGNYGVTFDLFEKVDVNGPTATPLYAHLTAAETKPQGSGPVRWNFEKFLVGKDGKIVARFKTGVEPNDETFVKAIENELKK